MKKTWENFNKIEWENKRFSSDKNLKGESDIYYFSELIKNALEVIFWNNKN